MDATTVAQVTAAMSGALLLVAAVAKLLDGAGTDQLVRALGAPVVVRGAVRRGLPWVELCAACWLLSGRAAVAASAAVTALATLFVAVLLLAHLRGVDAPCRCYGALDRAQPPEVSLARAVFVLAVAATALAATVAASRSADVALPGAASWAGAPLALCALLVFALAGQVLSFRRALRRGVHGPAGGGLHGVTRP